MLLLFENPILQSKRIANEASTLPKFIQNGIDLKAELNKMLLSDDFDVREQVTDPDAYLELPLFTRTFSRLSLTDKIQLWAHLRQHDNGYVMDSTLLDRGLSQNKYINALLRDAMQTKTIDEQIRQQRYEVNMLEGLERVFEKLPEPTRYKETPTTIVQANISITLNVARPTDILELFDKMVLSEVFPIAWCRNYSKLYRPFVERLSAQTSSETEEDVGNNKDEDEGGGGGSRRNIKRFRIETVKQVKQFKQRAAADKPGRSKRGKYGKRGKQLRPATDLEQSEFRANTMTLVMRKIDEKDYRSILFESDYHTNVKIQQLTDRKFTVLARKLEFDTRRTAAVAEHNLKNVLVQSLVSLLPPPPHNIPVIFSAVNAEMKIYGKQIFMPFMVEILKNTSVLRPLFIVLLQDDVVAEEEEEDENEEDDAEKAAGKGGGRIRRGDNSLLLQYVSPLTGGVVGLEIKNISDRGMVLVTLKGAHSLDDVVFFREKIFAYVLNLYDIMLPKILDDYCKLLPDQNAKELQDKVKLSIELTEEARAWLSRPTGVKGVYKRACETNRQPKILRDYNGLEKTAFTLQDKNDKQWYTCVDNKRYPYIGYNVGKIYTQLKLPPCCFKKIEPDRDKSDVAPVVQLPKALTALLNSVYSDVNHMFVLFPSSKTDLLNVVMSSPSVQAEFAEKKVLPLLQNNSVMARQSMFNYTTSEIKQKIIQLEQDNKDAPAFDSMYYTQLMESVFGVDIYVFDDNSLLVPRHTDVFCRLKEQILSEKNEQTNLQKIAEAETNLDNAKNKKGDVNDATKALADAKKLVRNIVLIYRETPTHYHRIIVCKKHVSAGKKAPLIDVPLRATQQAKIGKVLRESMLFAKTHGYMLTEEVDNKNVKTAALDDAVKQNTMQIIDTHGKLRGSRSRYNADEKKIAYAMYENTYFAPMTGYVEMPSAPTITLLKQSNLQRFVYYQQVARRLREIVIQLYAAGAGAGAAMPAKFLENLLQVQSDVLSTCKYVPEENKTFVSNNNKLIVPYGYDHLPALSNHDGPASLPERLEFAVKMFLLRNDGKNIKEQAQIRTYDSVYDFRPSPEHILLYGRDSLINFQAYLYSSRQVLHKKIELNISRNTGYFIRNPELTQQKVMLAVNITNQAEALEIVWKWRQEKEKKDAVAAAAVEIKQQKVRDEFEDDMSMQIKTILMPFANASVKVSESKWTAAANVSYGQFRNKYDGQPFGMTDIIERDLLYNEYFRTHEKPTLSDITSYLVSMYKKKDPSAYTEQVNSDLDETDTGDDGDPMVVDTNPISIKSIYKFSEFELLHALYRIISSNEPITNKYHQQMVLRECKGVFFLCNDMSYRLDVDTSTYYTRPFLSDYVPEKEVLKTTQISPSRFVEDMRTVYGAGTQTAIKNLGVEIYTERRKAKAASPNFIELVRSAVLGHVSDAKDDEFLKHLWDRFHKRWIFDRKDQKNSDVYVLTNPNEQDGGYNASIFYVSQDQDGNNKQVKRETDNRDELKKHVLAIYSDNTLKREQMIQSARDQKIPAIGMVNKYDSSDGKERFCVMNVSSSFAAAAGTGIGTESDVGTGTESEDDGKKKKKKGEDRRTMKRGGVCNNNSYKDFASLLKIPEKFLTSTESACAKIKETLRDAGLVDEYNTECGTTGRKTKKM